MERYEYPGWNLERARRLEGPKNRRSPLLGPARRISRIAESRSTARDYDRVTSSRRVSRVRRISNRLFNDPTIPDCKCNPRNECDNRCAIGELIITLAPNHNRLTAFQRGSVL